MVCTKKVNICGIDFTVEEVPPNARDDTFMGRSDIVACRISINSDMPEQQKQLTLIHEVLHCILDNHSFAKESNDEVLVSTLAAELYRLGLKL